MRSEEGVTIMKRLVDGYAEVLSALVNRIASDPAITNVHQGPHGI